ncbi:serine protease [Cronbergia sp. UHCC 0137]|uniref:S1 family peptidase n=1 Tax=Cronbergia sp. UHCC 0137 TaxID=3110239 RepID=UPI002B20117B|nr:serine protease [Cronbergia sp. UHCC 0137]MEA5618306.1 serine protease [Cronbergia sp. UHCC 0137]
MIFSFSRFGLLAAIGVVTIVISQSASAKTAKEVAQIAIPTTVRIDNLLHSNYGGSGVIIGKNRNIYTVLTASHVVGNLKNKYSIRTSNKNKYRIISLQNLQKTENDPDLAIVKFESTKEYPVAPISNSDQAVIGTDVYISGYPMSIKDNTEREYEFRKGQIISRFESKPQGYTMRYHPVMARGTSGGPVFDVSGRVIGIHGQGNSDPISYNAVMRSSMSDPVIRINRQSDRYGTSEVETEIKIGYSAAVPINTFKKLIFQAGIKVTFKEDNSPIENLKATQPTKSEVRSWEEDFATQ